MKKADLRTVAFGNSPLPKCPICKSDDNVVQHMSSIFICTKCGCFEDEDFDFEEEEIEMKAFDEWLND